MYQTKPDISEVIFVCANGTRHRELYFVIHLGTLTKIVFALKQVHAFITFSFHRGFSSQSHIFLAHYKIPLNINTLFSFISTWQVKVSSFQCSAIGNGNEYNGVMDYICAHALLLYSKECIFYLSETMSEYWGFTYLLF